MEPLHIKLERLAQARGLKQAAVVERLRPRVPKANKAQVSRWWSGASIPDLREAAALAAILDVPIAYLADDAMPEPRPASPERVQIEKLIAKLGEEVALDRLSMVVAAAAHYKVRPDPPPAATEPTRIATRSRGGNGGDSSPLRTAGNGDRG